MEKRELLQIGRIKGRRVDLENLWGKSWKEIRILIIDREKKLIGLEWEGMTPDLAFCIRKLSALQTREKEKTIESIAEGKKRREITTR